MEKNVKAKLSDILSGLGKVKGKTAEVSAFLNSEEGKKLAASLSDSDKKALLQKFMSLDAKEIEKKLKSFDSDFDFINSAHNGTHLAKDYIDDFIELDQRFIAGTAEKLESAAGFGWSDSAAGFGGGGDRYNYNRAHIIVFKAF